MGTQNQFTMQNRRSLVISLSPGTASAVYGYHQVINGKSSFKWNYLSRWSVSLVAARFEMALKTERYCSLPYQRLDIEQKR